YGSIAFTSPRAAHAVARRMKELAVGWPPVRSTPVVWATGPATAAGLGGGMGSVRLPAGRRTGRIGAARALGRAMVEKQASGPVLFPCGESHRDELPLELRAGGLSVDEVVCYRSVLAAIAEARMAAERGTVLVVTSPSVADLVARACPRGTRPELLAVGPTTAETARAAGWSPAAVATEPTARALASAIKSLLRKR
ncbi:MAG: uroporphyrinogen-III synthase, partial [Gemmatimonadales bacterium]